MIKITGTHPWLLREEPGDGGEDEDREEEKEGGAEGLDEDNG